VIGPYSEADWQRDVGAPRPLACPDCGHSENFGPKKRGTPEHHYRACKVCGFWQDADGMSAPFRCRLTAHVCFGTFASARDCGGCGNAMPQGVRWHLCARILAPRERWRCPECGTRVLTAHTIPWAVKRP
jgi:DNA-directed RNA polymerase subunit RPC12/RpoP